MTKTSTTPEVVKTLVRNQQTGEMLEIPAPKKTKEPYQFCRWHWQWEPKSDFYPYLSARCKKGEVQRSIQWHKKARQAKKAQTLTIEGNREGAVAVMADTFVQPTKKAAKKVAVKPDPTVLGHAPKNGKKMTAPKATNGAKIAPEVIAKARERAAKKVAAAKAEAK